MNHPAAAPPSRPTKPFPRDEYAARLKAFQRTLAAKKLDAAIVMTDLNRLYLTGFPSSNGLLLLERGERPVFFTDFRYLEAARAQLAGMADVQKIGKFSVQIGRPARRAAWENVGYEGGIPAARLAQWREALGGVKEWTDIDGCLLDQRAVKSPREQEVMRAAVAAGDLAYDLFLRGVRPGLTEWEMRRMFRRCADEAGQGESFDCIIATGPNSSKCHHHPGDRVLGARDTLLIDTGVLVGGYHSDLTRTVFIGPPPARMREIYKVVLEANRRAIAAIRPGRTGGDIDKIARGVIERAGYGRRFGHGLGHGVGLQIHERPSFAKDNKMALRAGALMTVEPGIYLPGVGGVRIEDIVLVTRRGCEVLSRTPKTLTVL